MKILYIESDYVERLNHFLTQNNQKTLAHFNKPVLLKENEIKFFRPMVCFSYDCEEEKILCFPLSSIKSTDN